MDRHGFHFGTISYALFFAYGCNLLLFGMGLVYSCSMISLPISTIVLSIDSPVDDCD
jgi:hypothetical protein